MQQIKLKLGHVKGGGRVSHIQNGRCKIAEISTLAASTARQPAPPLA